MRSAVKISLFIFILSMILCCFNDKTFAQQTIITVPSSDVLPLGNMILKETTRTKVNDGGYTRITPSVIFGVGHGMDFSFGVPTKIDQDYNTTVNGDIGLKKVWFLGSSTRLTVGGSVSPSFNMPQTPSMFTYAHVSQRIKKSKTSITFGGYMHGKNHFLNQGGILVGVDQVIVPNKLRVALDYMSGDNEKGNFAVGFKYRPVPSLSITSAVIIPNENTESVAFQVSLSKYISIDFDKNEEESEKDNEQTKRRL